MGREYFMDKQNLEKTRLQLEQEQFNMHLEKEVYQEQIESLRHNMNTMFVGIVGIVALEISTKTLEIWPVNVVVVVLVILMIAYLIYDTYKITNKKRKLGEMLDSRRQQINEFYKRLQA